MSEHADAIEAKIRIAIRGIDHEEAAVRRIVRKERGGDELAAYMSGIERLVRNVTLLKLFAVSRALRVATRELLPDD